jgi:hypothetical protein
MYKNRNYPAMATKKHKRHKGGLEAKSNRVCLTGQARLSGENPFLRLLRLFAAE